MVPADVPEYQVRGNFLVRENDCAGKDLRTHLFTVSYVCGGGHARRLPGEVNGFSHGSAACMDEGRRRET